MRCRNLWRRWRHRSRSWCSSDGRADVKPWHLVAWAAVAFLAGAAALGGRGGFGVAALVEAFLAGAWSWLLVRGE